MANTGRCSMHRRSDSHLPPFVFSKAGSDAVSGGIKNEILWQAVESTTAEYRRELMHCFEM